MCGLEADMEKGRHEIIDRLRANFGKVIVSSKTLKVFDETITLPKSLSYIWQQVEVKENNFLIFKNIKILI